MTRHQIGFGAEPEIVAWLVQRLRFALEPVTRDTLTDELLAYVTGTYGLHWQTTTAARRLREAINRATEDGWPIVSVHGGFQLARTRADRHQAAERLRKTARRLFVRAEKLDGAAVSGDMLQGELFGEAV